MGIARAPFLSILSFCFPERRPDPSSSSSCSAIVATMSTPRRRRMPTTSAAGASRRRARLLEPRGPGIESAGGRETPSFLSDSSPASSVTSSESASSDSSPVSESLAPSLPTASLDPVSIITHRDRGSSRTATTSPSSALFLSVLVGINKSRPWAPRWAPPSSPSPSPSSSPSSPSRVSFPTRTVASSGRFELTRIVPRIRSPSSRPASIASASQCGGNARLREPEVPGSIPPFDAKLCASIASRQDSNAPIASASCAWNLGKYSDADSTSTPGGSRLRISAAMSAPAVNPSCPAVPPPPRPPPRSVSARDSERTTTGNAPRTLPAYHAAALSTGS